jgi:hypothetical protein
MSRISAALLAALLLCALAGVARAAPDSGRELIEESLRRHGPPPFAYEELTIVLRDAAGRQRVRTARHFRRTDPDGTVQRLIAMQSPADVRGSSLLLKSRNGEPLERLLHLPALGRTLSYDPAGGSVERLFGTDLSLADIEGERPALHAYEREADRDLDRIPHHSIRARPAGATGAAGAKAASHATGYGLRRLFLRKDSLFLTRIDYFDREGRLIRQQTFRDPRPDGDGALRPAMILLVDLRERHSTLVKVDRRVHSADYVPAELSAAAAP